MYTAKQIATVAIAEAGIELESVFVPFSQSRMKDEEFESLNWKVTIKRNGREVLTTDYTAGQAHCPSYKFNLRRTQDYARKITHECETGTVARVYHGMGHIAKGKKIDPDPVDVLYSLVMDSSVLDSGGFEDWAFEFGYDPDSRKAYGTYKACLDIALKLRAGLGDEIIRDLQEAFQDY